MLYGLVMVVHVIACLVLILVILLQAGRGGGLSEGFGDTVSQSLFGTKSNVLLTRATTVCAVLFILTCLVLDVMTSQRGKSLIKIQGIQPGARTAAMPAAQTSSANTVKDVADATNNLPAAAPESPAGQQQ